MKKIVCSIIAIAIFAGAFAGCGKTNKDKSEGTNIFDIPDIPTEQEWDISEYPKEANLTEQQKAIVAVAKAYYNRGAYLQYDDTRLVSGSVVKPVIYRWSRCIDTIENSPEDATSQYTCYTNCAAWAHDVYLEAFNFEIGAWYVGLFHDDLDMRVLYHTVTGKETEEEKANIIAEFKANLEVGDVINCNHVPSGAHTLVYVGGGKILHSAVPNRIGGNYNYEKNMEKWEPNGTVDYTTVDDMFTEGNRYYLWGEKSFSITRPLKKFPQMQVSEKTRKRMENLENIVAEMTSSHPGSVTADLGEEITYTFTVKNYRDTEVTLDIEDVVPEGSTYVRGGDRVEGNKISWSAKIPAKKMLKVSYTVKVNDDPELYTYGYIFSENAKVGGVSLKCRPVYVGKHLNADQQEAIADAAKKVTMGNLKGTDLAEKIYADAGLTLDIEGSAEILESMFKVYKSPYTHKAINEESTYVKILAPTMYGGYYVANTDLYYSRTRGMRGDEIMAGDIFIRLEGKNEPQTFMYIGEGKLINLDSGEILSEENSHNEMFGTIGFDRFVVLRPALQ